MTLPSRRIGMIVSIVASLAASAPAGAGGRTLFHRIVPTDVRWGEFSVVDGGAATIDIDNRDVDFPFTLEIACDQRERREDPGGTGAQAVAPPPRRRGTIYAAVDASNGLESWDAALDALRVRLARQTPETFGTFARKFVQTLLEPGVIDGAFHAVVCITVEGESDQAEEARRVIDKESVTAHTSGFHDAKAVCASLVREIEGAAPSSVLMSRFEVREARDEELVYTGAPSPGAERAPWPPGAGIATGPPPPGATSYWNTSGGAPGEAYFEELRTPRSSDGKPYLLKSRAKPASIPKSDLDADALLTRWAWQVRDEVLGAEPKGAAEPPRSLDVAFFFPEPHGRLDADGLASAVARELASSDRPPGIPLVQSILLQHVLEMGADAMFAVYCDSATPTKAVYCVSRACDEVSNAEEFCRALASRLDDGSSGAR